MIVYVKVATSKAGRRLTRARVKTWAALLRRLKR